MADLVLFWSRRRKGLRTKITYRRGAVIEIHPTGAYRSYRQKGRRTVVLRCPNMATDQKYAQPLREGARVILNRRYKVDWRALPKAIRRELHKKGLAVFEGDVTFLDMRRPKHGDNAN